MTAPLASILTAPGTNRDGDVAFALQLAGFRTEQIDVRQVGSAPNSLRESAAVVVAGGFSYADALGAGRLFALELHHALHDVLQGAIQRGVPVLGICNGFQVLVRLGILPGAGQQAALGHNESGQFACQWVRLAAPSSRCVWTTGLTDGVDCPIAHGEGRFTCDDTTWASLVANEQIALQYTSGNPNGSRGDVAG
ncbi:MAG: phosphoribosylformylglycinamidine synthase subunit PurQ, partial [Ilumatobacteraceae bacterium]|nr:phosphoribosylformylglycinamidine synthase subunit PurQ [Ilumatobacteraceae bacterium]